MNERKVDVYLDDRLVGTLAETADRRVAFAYSDAWLESGFAISPFSLPVEQKVFVPSSRTFHGLWGVFADSLPDAWGRLLVDGLCGLVRHCRAGDKAHALPAVQRILCRAPV